MRKKITIIYGLIILASVFLPLLPSNAADRQCAYYSAVLLGKDYQCSGLHNFESPLADCQNVGQKCCVQNNINANIINEYFFSSNCNANVYIKEEPDVSKCLNSRKWKCCCHTSTVQQKQTVESKPPLFVAPELQIDLPTLTLTDKVQCTVGEGGSWECKIPWIGEYVKAIYDYGLGIAGILAAIVLMAGGVVWLISAGDASRVSLAKELISGSVTGLVILMSSYVLLIQINPELVNFRPIKIGAIQPSEVELPEGPKNVTGDRTETKYIVIHTSANSKFTRDDVDKYHKSMGWNGIGYNVYIERNGQVVMGRGEDAIGAHAGTSGNWNNDSIGISYAGCDPALWNQKGNWETVPMAIDKEVITYAQLTALISTIKKYQAKYNIPTAKVLGHAETGAPKACPCLPMDEIRKALSPS